MEESGFDEEAGLCEREEGLSTGGTKTRKEGKTISYLVTKLFSSSFLSVRTRTRSTNSCESNIDDLVFRRREDQTSSNGRSVRSSFDDGCATNIMSFSPSPFLHRHRTREGEGQHSPSTALFFHSAKKALGSSGIE